MIRRVVAVVGLVALLGVLMLPSASPQEPPATFRIIVFPDSQNAALTEEGGAIIDTQFDWIIADQPTSRTVFMSHVGDVVYHPNSQTQWDRVEPGFTALEAAGIPYGISPGNHELVNGGGPVEYDVRFPLSRWQPQPWFGDGYESSRSTWQTVSVDGHDLLFVHVRHLLEAYGPTAPVLDWVDAVLTAHPDHLTFVTTHQFTGSTGSINMPALRDVLDDHCTVAAVFSGHRPGEAARGTFEDSCGRTVHHVLTNYQFIENGGDGYLRTVDIDPLSLQTEFAVYSPHLDQYRTGEDEAFSAQLSPLPLVQGDADCDRQVDIIDALAVAQYVVGLRSDRTTCPLAVGASEANVANGDVDGDENTDIVDALFIAQCTVGLPNPFCSGP